MFDGIYDPRRFPTRRPKSPRPPPIDTRHLLPLLRTQAVDAGLSTLAHVVAGNAIAYSRWLDLNWPNGDFDDPAHPARAAALEESSPRLALVRAQCALEEACQRYRAATGNDGLQLAYEIIERYGRQVAEAALRPLTEAASLWGTLDETAPPEPAPDPTPEEWQAGRLEIATWMLQDPDLAGLAEPLEALRRACDAAGDPHRDPGVSAALEALAAVISDIVARDAELVELVELSLDAWAAANPGAPQIRLTPGTG
jgi:hypothetical protein